MNQPCRGNTNCLTLLTESDFNNFITCPCFLWLKKKRPDLLAGESLEARRRAETSMQVRDMAEKLFPGVVAVEGFGKTAWESTRRLMTQGTKTLFHPTVMTKHLACRADIATYNEAIDGWDLHGVKMTTLAKKEHVYDIAFQRICFEEAGLRVGDSHLMHINNAYVRHGPIEPEKLFVSDNISESVASLLGDAKLRIAQAEEMLGWNDDAASRLVGTCPNPKTCDYLRMYCEAMPGRHAIAQDIPPTHLRALMDREILDHTKISSSLLSAVGYAPEPAHVQVDAPGIMQELGKLEYPLYFLDYETYNHALPPFDGFRPYQNIPFQYSLHIKNAPKAPLEHAEFLARTFEDPVPALASHLHKHLGTRGSVIVWSAAFESGRNKEMGELHPQFADFLHSVNDRMFDLMLLFTHKNQLYYDSRFKKSASLKIVLPVLLPDLSYEDLAIQEGGSASSSWPVLTSPETPEEEKERLAKDMLLYCKRDTEAMVAILDRVTEVAGAQKV